LLIPPQRLAAIQRGDIWRLEAAALQHNTETVVSELARSLGVSRAQARRIVNDEMGEPMVVAAKAVELPAEALRRVLLFMTPWAGQSVDRIYELAELYAEISVEAACRLISIWRNADPAENGHIHYEPVRWPAAAENARRALSEGSRRPELQQDVRARSGER
jgi:hypothetical protein